MKSCAHWLNWKCGIGLNAARERVRVAHAIKDLPQTRVLFREGYISYSKVRALTRAAKAKNEATLLNIALNGTAWHLEYAVRQFRRCQRREMLKNENERQALRQMNWYTDVDGCLIQSLHAAPMHWCGWLSTGFPETGTKAVPVTGSSSTCIPISRP